MKVIQITAEANSVLRSAALYEMREDGEKQPDGSWKIPVSEELIKRMNSNLLRGETYSDLICRAVAYYHAKGRAQ